MKKIITLFFVGSLITSTISTTFAQLGVKTTYTANNLTPELNAIVESVKTECNLDAEQYKKFKNDYVLFLNENAKPKANTKGLLFLLGTKVKPYFKADQFAKLTKMGQDGKLTPKTTTTPVLGSQDTKVPAAPVTTTLGSPDVKIATPPTLSVTAQSNLTQLFQQLQAHMKVTPENAEKVIPILKNYDEQLNKLRRENSGNEGKIKQLTDALNEQTVPKLKMYMTDQQIGTLVAALGMQQNILSGKNITADQKIFLDKIRNEYGLNDVQTMSVVLVLVQARIRGDAISILNKTNPQQAGQEFIKLLQDIDGQLKSALSNDQYVKVKAEIERLIKEHKL